jgi:hypothetical protein
MWVGDYSLASYVPTEIQVSGNLKLSSSSVSIDDAGYTIVQFVRPLYIKDVSEIDTQAVNSVPLIWALLPCPSQPNSILGYHTARNQGMML